MRYLLFIFWLSVTLQAGIGKVTALEGSLSIERFGHTYQGHTGFTLDAHDTINTTANSKAQIIFNDQTAITIGQNSTFSIKQYLYRKSEHSSSALFSFTKGVFQTITGKISKISPKRFKLKTKTAVIGVRGTEIYMDIQPDKEYIACTGGAIHVTSDLTGVRVDVAMGEATTVSSGGSPTQPTPYEANDVNGLAHSSSTRQEERSDIDNAVSSQHTESTLSHIEPTTEETKITSIIAPNVLPKSTTNSYDFMYPDQDHVDPYTPETFPEYPEYYDPQKWSREPVSSGAEYTEYGKWRYDDGTHSAIYGLYAATTSPTPEANIESLQSASYSGNIKALHQDYEGSSAYHSGTINLLVDFGNETVSGDMNIGNGLWKATINEDTITTDANHFTHTNISDNGGTHFVDSGTLMGSLAGPNAQEMYGHVDLSTKNELSQFESVKGVYTAEKTAIIPDPE
jgi:hypothetical protein